MLGERSSDHALNAICPYFTMFPLSFPLSVLAERSNLADWVLDPFCGRGTTNFAARLHGLPTVGIDSSPVGAAVAAAKLVAPSPQSIVRAARSILAETPEPNSVPEGVFWDWAYAPEVLQSLCRLRESLIKDAMGPTRTALRAIILGALHGPRTKGTPSHLSNQCPRTYAPKPRYATTFWQERELRPESVDILDVIERRAKRYFTHRLPKPPGFIRQADSRERSTFARLGRRFRWVITSPPYYGMRTYIPDQWLRNWFLGGPPEVDYSQSGQLTHAGRAEFVADLTVVWRRVSEVCLPDATMVVRFGAIQDRAVSSLDLLGASLGAGGWEITNIVPAGAADDGRRQADHFVRERSKALAEHDVWAKRCS
jgi:hypothetical protein